MEVSLLLLLLLISPFFCTLLSQKDSDVVGRPPPAAAPVLQGGPFVVVWNMPTANCQKRYDVQLDLEDFGIVENPKQHFQGDKMSIFYRDRLGKYPYLSHDGREVNGGIPQLGDLSAHLSLTGSQLTRLLQPSFSGVAVIDWEEWQPLWENNFDSKGKYRMLSKLLVRQQRPELMESEVMLLAKQSFEKSSRRFMEETLREALRHRPRGFWGFYGFPYCFNKHTRSSDESYTGRCHSGTRRHNDQLSWLWTQSTALFPSIYLPQRLAGSADAALMVRHRLLEALRVASRWPHDNRTGHATPVLPYARLAFTHSLNFLNKTDLEHTLGESAALGAAGVVLWGDLKFAKSEQQCLILKDYVHNILGPFVRSLRSDARSCSFQLCHGNGRCARKHASCGHSLSSPADGSSDSNSSKDFHKHFTCQCYAGFTGQECEEESREDR